VPTHGFEVAGLEEPLSGVPLFKARHDERDHEAVLLTGQGGDAGQGRGLGLMVPFAAPAAAAILVGLHRGRGQAAQPCVGTERREEPGEPNSSVKADFRWLAR
jgi:hypothetical protein